jgi:hypothetical protein
VSAAARAAFARATRKASERDDAFRGIDDAGSRRGGSFDPERHTTLGALSREARRADDAPIQIDALEEDDGRVRRLNLLSAEIDRPNVAGTVGVSLAWRREVLPGRSIPTLGSLTTIRLAVNVNLKTRSRKIRHARSFFFALGREADKRKAPQITDFGDVDLPVEVPVAAPEVPVPDPEEAIQAPATVSRDAEDVSAPARIDAPAVPTSGDTRSETVDEPRSPSARPTSTPSRTPPTEPAPRSPAPNVARRTSELDELLAAMERTQRSDARPPSVERPSRPEQSAARSDRPADRDVVRNVVRNVEPVSTARPAGSVAALREPASAAAVVPRSQVDDALHPLLQRRPVPQAPGTPTPSPRVSSPSPRPGAGDRLPEAQRLTPPAGWYPDPAGHAELRYWDRGWTTHVKTNGRLSASPLPRTASPKRTGERGNAPHSESA